MNPQPKNIAFHWTDGSRECVYTWEALVSHTVAEWKHGRKLQLTIVVPQWDTTKSLSADSIYGGEVCPRKKTATN